jgi:hypothetical protein
MLQKLFFMSIFSLMFLSANKVLANDHLTTSYSFDENCNKVKLMHQHFKNYSFFYFGTSNLTSRYTCVKQKSESGVFGSSSRWICLDYFQETKIQMSMGGTTEYSFSDSMMTLTFPDGSKVRYGTHTPFGSQPMCPFPRRRN